MKPPAFEYERPRTVVEAIALLDRYGEEAKLIAGGQSLLPLLNFRLAEPERLIDIDGLEELAYIEVGEVLRIGALTRTAELLRSAAVTSWAPLLVEAAAHVAHPQIRNRGTVGGSVAHADPAAELPAALLALDASFVASSAAGEREIAASEFFQGVYTTALEPNEMVVEIRVPPTPGPSAFEEFARRSGDFAIGAVACQLGEPPSPAVRLAAIGVAGQSVRLRAAEARLGPGAGQEEVGAAVAAELESSYPSAERFVRRVVVELAQRAYARAAEVGTKGGSNGT